MSVQITSNNPQLQDESGPMRTPRNTAVPISEKVLLTLEEAAQFSGVGINKLREISSEESCNFVLWNGTKRMLKRKKLEAYLEQSYSI